MEIPCTAETGSSRSTNQTKSWNPAQSISESGRKGTRSMINEHHSLFIIIIITTTQKSQLVTANKEKLIIIILFNENRRGNKSLSMITISIINLLRNYDSI